MLKTVCFIKTFKDYFPTMRGRATAVRWPAESPHQCACKSSPPDRPLRACAVRGHPIRPCPEIYDSRRKIPKQIKNNWNSSGKRPNMAGEEEDMGSLLMDIADCDLFNIFSEEWAMEMEIGLETEAECVGRAGFFAETGPNILGTEPPESTDPIETMMGAYGIAPLSPQGQPPSRHGQPPSRHGSPPSRHGYPPSQHGYPPAQPEQPTTGGEGGEWCTISLLFENSIVLIKCTLYDTVFQR